MASAIEVASLFSTLGLRVNKGEWQKGDDAIGRAQSALGSLAKLAAGALAGFSFGAAIKAGIGFNATMEDTRNQIAGMLSLAKHTDMADQLEDTDVLMKSLQERAKKLPGSLNDYTKVLGMIAQPITDAGIGLKDLEDITVGAAVAAKAMSIDLEAGARDVNQAIMGQFHSTDQLTGRILGSLGYIGEEGRKRFNDLSKARRAAVLKEALTQRQLTQMADAQSKAASGRWDTFKANVAETLGRVAAPLFAKLSTLLAGANDWLEKNSAAIDTMANVIGTVLGGALDAVVGILGFLTSGGDEAIAALVAIGATILAFVVPALAAMAVGWIAAAAPIIAVVAAVAAITYGIIKLIRNWDRVRAVGARAWDWIKDKAQGFVDYIRALPGRIVDGFQAMVESIKEFFSDLFDWIIAEAKKLPGRIPVLGRLGRALGEGAGAAANWISGDTHLDAIDEIVESPAGSSAPAYTPPAGASTRSISVGSTTIEVHAAPGMSEERVGEIAGAAARESLNDALRLED